MDETNKMLQVIINVQSALKQELLGEIRKVDRNVDKLENQMGSLRSEMQQGFTTLTARVDKLGLQLAKLEDDSPTKDEFDKLVKRVERVEQKLAS